MSISNIETDQSVALVPGDIIAIETASGTRHIQVTHTRAPYPDVVRAILPVANACSLDEIAQGETAFSAMVELRRSLRESPETTELIGKRSLPKGCKVFPTFRIPIRDKSGETVYWWTWDGEGLEVSPEAADTDLPLREIVPMSALRSRLAKLVG